MIKGKVYDCKYKFTYDKLQQPTIRFYVEDRNCQVIRVMIKDVDISNCNYIECHIRNLNTDEKYIQDTDISIHDNTVVISLNDEYINIPGNYIIQLILYNKDNDKVLERAVVKPISFMIED